VAESFGELLRRLRVGASLTQEGLAERARLSADTIAALERGRRRAPRLSTVGELADALGLDPAARASLARAASGTAVAEETVDRPKTTQRRSLPAVFTPLVGRYVEVEAVAHELGTEHLVTLVGPGGVGKTRLALAVATATVDKFEGGTWWAELGSVGDGDVVANTLLDVVGGTEQPGRPLVDQIVAALPDEPVLLVVDNCEHVIDAAAAVVTGLLRSPSISVLATSREPLGIPGEITWPVPTLSVPAEDAPVTAEQLADIESVELFVERASRADPAFELTDGNAVAVGRICRRLEGIPLALELMASRIRVFSPWQLADELDDRFSLAAPTARGVPDRQTTLWASIDWSYQLLTEDERAVFHSTAGFAASFTAEAVATISSQVRTATKPSEAREVLARLATKSLLSLESPRAEAGRPIRYRLLDPTDATVDVIGSEYHNLRAALAWSIERGAPRAADLVAAFGVTWYLLSRFHDARTLGDQALAVVVDKDPGVWARAVGMLALARLVAGDGPFVLNAIPAAAEIARARGDALAEGWCCFVLGSLPPNDASQTVTAYELGIKASSPTLAAVAAANAATSGTDDRPDEWLTRMAELESQTDNSSVRGACDVARLELWIERGLLELALDRALPLALDTRLVPALRVIWVDRVVQIAYQRCDEELAGRAMSMVDDIARVLPPGGFWGLELQRLRLALVRGERPPLPSLDWIGRVGLQPGAIRTLCRAALDRGERLDPMEVAKERFSSPSGSLIAASIAAVRGAWALFDGDDETAVKHWDAVLTTAASRSYLLLVCDALEAFGCLATRRGPSADAGVLFASAASLRHEITYRFRFNFEQAAVAQAGVGIGAHPGDDRLGALPWRKAVNLALAQGHA
jgi:predicted ATPase/transcriptional regulator with XRE-family HTH domain